MTSKLLLLSQFDGIGGYFFSMFKIILYNVNGLNSKQKSSKLRKLVSKWKPTVLLIQESKIKYMLGKDNHFWGNDSFDWRASNAFGRSGGIITIWNSDIISCIDTLEGAFSLNCLFSNKSDAF